MFGSKSEVLFAHCRGPDAGPVAAAPATGPGALATGSSPAVVSAWSLSRYGQNVTAAESETPAGQLASSTGAPLTGFSGTGGLSVVADGETMSGQTAGPGVGRDTVPVHRPHQSLVAVTGAAALAVVPSSVVLRTPNALSVMLLA